MKNVSLRMSTSTILYGEIVFSFASQADAQDLLIFLGNSFCFVFLSLSYTRHLLFLAEILMVNIDKN